MKALAVLALVLSSVSAYAGEKCEGTACYDFQEGSWLGWSEDVCPLSGCNNYVTREGVGTINVLNNPPNPLTWTGNHTHLRWAEAGEGFLSARVVFGFNGDNGHTGWIEKLNDGIYNDINRCHGTTHAPRASDEVIILAVMDTGDEWIGVYWGGDEHPWANQVHPYSDTMPQRTEPYSVAGIARVKKDSSEIRVLSRVFLPEALMGEILSMSISVQRQLDADGKPTGPWWARAIGRYGEERWDTEVPLYDLPTTLVPRGYVSLMPGVNPAPYCIWHNPDGSPTGGMFDRQFVVLKVSAWR